jgi:hypothetical protein
MMLPTADEIERANAKRAEARTTSLKAAEAGVDDDAAIEMVGKETVARLSKEFGKIIPEFTL